MLRRLALAALIALLPALASAQMALIAPTAPTSDNNDRIANTQWVNLFFAQGLPLANGKIFIGSAGGVATQQTPSGDCTIVPSGVITCTQAAGNFNVIGNLTVGGNIIDGNGLLMTNIAAPGTPSAGTTRVYIDSSTKVLSYKNDAGTIGVAVVPSTCGANLFGTSITAAGVHGCTQPSFANLSGQATLAQLPSMGAYTFLANNTAGSATPTAVDGTALTLKASPGASDIVVIQDVSASNAFKKTTVSALASFPLRGYLSGLTLSTAGGSQVFAIAAGVAVDSTATDTMTLASFTKTEVGGGTWVVGSGNAALDTGTFAISTWYHVFVIKRPDTGVVDVCITVTVTGCTTGGAIPAAYTLQRRIGSMKTDGSFLWIKFTQNGDEFLWSTPVLDGNNLAITNVAGTVPLTVPPGVRVNASIGADFTNTAAAGSSALLYALDTGTQAAGSPTGNWTLNNSVANQYVANQVNLRTNTSALIGAVALAAANNSLYVITLGWIDRRGRDQ